MDRIVKMSLKKIFPKTTKKEKGKNEKIESLEKFQNSIKPKTMQSKTRGYMR